MMASVQAAIHAAYKIMATNSLVARAAFVGRHGFALCACEFALEARAFERLPGDETRHADRNVRDPLDERDRKRLVGRDAEDRAQHDEPALLCAERARDGEGRAAHGVGEAF